MKTLFKTSFATFLSLAIVALFLGCQRTQVPPGYGVGLSVFCQECESIKAEEKPSQKEGFVMKVTVGGKETGADPLIERQIRDYLAEHNPESYNGGSVMQKAVYCDRVCESITITSSSVLFGQDAGQDLSGYFSIYYSDNPYLIDRDKNLIGVLEPGMSVKSFLSKKVRMLPDMELRLEASGESLNGITLTVRVILEGGVTLQDVCETLSPLDFMSAR